MPDRFKNIAQKIQNVITDSPLPEVFRSMVESRIIPPQIESEIEIPASVTNSIASTVRIDGIAESCSAAMVGTGFIIANERVITNAHVVAGVKEPVITLSNSQTQLGGRVIAIDRKKDIAIIFVPGLHLFKETKKQRTLNLPSINIKFGFNLRFQILLAYSIKLSLEE